MGEDKRQRDVHLLPGADILREQSDFDTIQGQADDVKSAGRAGRGAIVQHSERTRYVVPGEPCRRRCQAARRDRAGRVGDFQCVGGAIGTAIERREPW